MDKPVTVTLKQIEKIFNISRTTFNEKYKAHVKQVPSLNHINLYDYDSVKEWHEKRPILQRGRKRKSLNTK